MWRGIKSKSESVHLPWSLEFSAIDSKKQHAGQIESNPSLLTKRRLLLSNLFSINKTKCLFQGFCTTAQQADVFLLIFVLSRICIKELINLKLKCL